MKILLGSLAVLGATILLASCGMVPTSAQLSSADYGGGITVDECKDIGEQTIAKHLKDPTSAQFLNQTCNLGYASADPIHGLAIAFGWVLEGEVNAKNTTGEYVGFRKYSVLVRNSVAIRSCISDEHGVCRQKAE